MGAANEADLRTLVTNRFPTMFLNRAKQIALAELDQNQRIVDQEARWYGVNGCVDPAARNALTAAAADLVRQDARIAQLQAAVNQIRSSVDPPSGGVPDPVQVDSSYRDLLARQEAYHQAVLARDQARNRHAMQHPVLQLRGINLQILASLGTPPALATTSAGRFTEISNNIRDTKANITSGRLKVWNLNNIVQMTAQDLRVTGNQTLEAVVQSRINEERSDEAMVQAAWAALAITAAIVATIASGGLALAAGTVALGVGAYNVAESVRNYLANSAAARGVGSGCRSARYDRAVTVLAGPTRGTHPRVPAAGRNQQRRHRHRGDRSSADDEPRAQTNNQTRDQAPPPTRRTGPLLAAWAIPRRPTLPALRL